MSATDQQGGAAETGGANESGAAANGGAGGFASSGAGVQLPGDGVHDAGANVGKNGIQMKWPPHPGEHGTKGAEKHKQWKSTVKCVMWMKNIDERLLLSSHRCMPRGMQRDC